MKSAKVMKKSKAKTRKPTVPKNVQEIITEVFSGHEKLYDAVAQLWLKSSKRIFKLPNLERVYNDSMMFAMHDKMHDIFYENVHNAKTRYLQSKGVRAAFAAKPK